MFRVPQLQELETKTKPLSDHLRLWASLRLLKPFMERRSDQTVPQETGHSLQRIQ